jgi:two-component system nitrogen regulation sensor histidine kinase GlnL
MKELCFYTDRNLAIRSCDDSLADLTGKSRSRIIGKKYDDVFPKIYLRNKDAVSEVVKKKKALSLKGYQFGCLHAFSKADIKIRPIKNNNGSVKEVKVTVRPVTSCSIAQKLHRSQRFIDIGKIASTLAHGVRNPLNAIKGAVVYLRDKYAGEESLREFTQIMEDEISRLEQYISSFLSSSGSSSAPEPTNINLLIEKIKTLISLQAYANRVNCVYELGAVPKIRMNPFHLEQAILNVVNNAIEAMKSGGTLRVRTGTEERSDHLFISVEISDTGPGIPSTDVTDLGAGPGNGKGYGLLIAYEMIKRYDGHMEIISEQATGTTVRFYLPVPKTGVRPHGD